MQAIQELGDSVARAWLACDYADDAFAAIASHALRESDLLHHFSQSQLSEWFLTESRLPEQQFRDFGQPALTLYRGHKFYIELLYWLDSTTAIHQHSFAGAFGVFGGSSLHTQYDFHYDKVISSEFILGELTFRSSELLTPGDVQEIVPGDKYIHSLFHLERPSLTLVVRTHSLTQYYPQYTYRRPGIGYDPFYKPEPFATRLRLLEALRDISSDDFWSLAREMLLQCDPWMTFALLSMAYAPGKATSEWDNLLEVARERHGSLIDIFVRSFKEKTREQNITARRREIWDADHRFFLALLLNLPHRPAIYRLIAQKHPESDPEALILRWLGELAATHKIGLDFDVMSLKMLQHALRDLSLEDMVGGLAAVFGEAQVQEERSNLDRLWSEIHEASLLRPLLEPGIPEPVVNPGAQVWTELKQDQIEFKVEAPVRGEGLRCTNVSVKSHPEAFRLLMRVGEDDQNGNLTLTDQEAKELRRLGLLLPAEELPRPVELDVTVTSDEDELRVLCNDPECDVRFKPEMDRLPHVPIRLLPKGEIVLVRDRVRDMWFPQSLTSSQVEALRDRLNSKSSNAEMLRADVAHADVVCSDKGAQLREEWRGALGDVRRKLTTHTFALLPSLLPPPLLSAVAQYYRQRVAEGYIGLINGQTNLYAVHREPLAEWIHPAVGEILRSAFPVEVKPSYSYLCIYKGGAMLEKHTDRPQCEFTVSLCVDASAGGERWPLYVESPVDEAIIEARIGIGDAIIFKGRELPHFRDVLGRGESFTSLLFHFVEATYQGGLD